MNKILLMTGKFHWTGRLESASAGWEYEYRLRLGIRVQDMAGNKNTGYGWD